MLTELLVIDVDRWSDDMLDALLARCWEEVRSARPLPTDRAYSPPEGALVNFVLTQAEVEELLARLVRYRDAPPVTRIEAESSVIRAFILSGWWDDRAGAALAELERYVRRIGSPTADVLCAELHGILARRRRQWSEAAAWYGRVASSAGFQPGSVFGLVCGFHHLATRALAGDPSLTGADLREPWIRRRLLAVTVVDHLGAVSTATALDHLGHPDLARRLIEWFAADAHDTTKQLFADTLDASGHQLPESPPAHLLDELLDEVFAIADDLDRVGLPTAR